MFPIVINDGQTEMPDADIYYIVGKEGIFIKKRLGIMESLSPVKNISILKSVQSSAKMHIPPLPSIMAAKVLNFFRVVYDKYSAEAIVLLFYNQETKKFKLHVPSQKVSAGGVDYNRAITIDGYTMIGDIHSHAGMSAFHSGIDQGDEESFDGLHITFGNMRSDNISISSSIVSNGYRTIVNPEEYLNGIKLVAKVDEIRKVPMTRVYKYDSVRKELVEDTSSYKATTYRTYREYDKRYKVLKEHTSKATMPKTWIDNVEKKTWKPKVNEKLWNWWAHGYGYQNGFWKDGKWTPPKANNRWGDKFDPNFWNNHSQKPGHLADTIRNKTKDSPLNVGVKRKPIEFPKHDDDEPFVTDITPEKNIPCERCSFKDSAFQYIAAQLAEEYGIIEGDDEFEDDTERYYRSKCQILVEFEYDDEGEIKGKMVCPSCESDEHLLEIIDNEDEGSDVPVYDALDDHGDDSNLFECQTCHKKFDVHHLVEGPAGGECPVCGVLLYPNQSCELHSANETVSCANCQSEFTYDMVKDDRCPYCQSLLLDNQEAVNEAALKEMEQPNPHHRIPHNDKGPFGFMHRWLKKK